MGLAVAVGAAAVISVTSVLETVAVVGAVMSVVGTITKNKTLATIGMALGVVGGVGALASSAIGGAAVLGDTAVSGATDAVVSEAGSAAASGGVEAGAWDVAASAGGDAVSSAAVPDVIGGLSNGLGSVTEAAADPGVSLAGEVPAGTEMAAQDAAGLQANVANAAEGGASNTGLVTSSAPVNAADTVVPGTSGVPAGAGPAAAPTSPGSGLSVTANPELNTPGAAIEAPASSGSGFGDTLDKLVAYAGKNPVVALGVLQAGGSLLSGWTSTLTPAQISALNSQAAANDAAAALTKQQTANLAMPKAVASSAPVTGAPQPLVQPTVSPGFINNQPKILGAAA